MPTLEIPPYSQLQQLFALVENDHAELLPVCRWLVLGARLGDILLPDDEPTAAEVLALLRLLWARAPELENLGRILAYNSEHGEDAYVEVCVDRLMEATDWKHPTQVLDRPRPDFRKLLAAARERRKRARGRNRAALGPVIARLEVAIRVAGAARARRERRRLGRIRKRPSKDER